MKHNTKTRRASPTNTRTTRRGGGRSARSAIWLTACLLGTVLLAPAASADNTTSRTVCFPSIPGQNTPSDALPGMYCATGRLETRVECTGSGPSYECTVHARGFIDPEGALACGSTKSTALGGHAALSCNNIGQLDDTDQTPWVDATYTASQIGSEGRTVEDTVEVCAWIDHADAVPRCEEYVHHDYLPPNPNAGGVQGLVDRVTGVVNHAVRVVEDAESPVGAHT